MNITLNKSQLKGKEYMKKRGLKGAIKHPIQLSTRKISQNPNYTRILTNSFGKLVLDHVKSWFEFPQNLAQARSVRKYSVFFYGNTCCMVLPTKGRGLALPTWLYPRSLLTMTMPNGSTKRIHV